MNWLSLFTRSSDRRRRDQTCYQRMTNHKFGLPMRGNPMLREIWQLEITQWERHFEDTGISDTTTGTPLPCTTPRPAHPYRYVNPQQTRHSCSNWKLANYIEAGPESQGIFSTRNHAQCDLWEHFTPFNYTLCMIMIVDARAPQSNSICPGVCEPSGLRTYAHVSHAKYGTGTVPSKRTSLRDRRPHEN